MTNYFLSLLAWHSKCAVDSDILKYLKYFINIIDYPISIQKHTVKESMSATRACTSGKLMEGGKSVITQKTCKNDAVKLWNFVPKHVQTCKSLIEIKTHISIFVKTLPI